MRPISSWPNNACMALAYESGRREEGRETSVPFREVTPRPSRQNRPSSRTPPVGSFHQRAAAVLERAERLVGRDRREDLVIVPRRLRLRRCLHLDQVARMYLAAVAANRALAEQRVVGRHLFHLRDDLRAVGIALERFDRLEVMK